MISSNLGKVYDHIASICKRLGRNAEEITLVGVTKYAELSLIKEAVAAGLEHIGENRVQDAEAKFPELMTAGKPIIKHMIGHLQTNKVKKAVELFDVIQSVDSIKLLNHIDKQAANISRDIDILIQVNTSKEEQKFGIAPEKVPELIEAVLKTQHVFLKGFMTIGPLTDDDQSVRLAFKSLKTIYDQTAARYAGNPKVDLKYCSMGMSGDFEVALEEGANMLRIGSAIFKNE